MKKEILIFSKYFGYAVGGAEKSIYELLKQKEEEGYKINVLLVENVETFNAKKFKMAFPSSWKIKTIKFKTDSIRFYYLHYFINKKIVEDAIKEFDENKYVLYSYGIYAPAAINAFKGETVYLVRDEYGLGWNNNYFKGIKKVLKDIYRFVDYPFYIKWKQELIKAMKKSHLIANSNFIAKEIFNLTGKKAEIIYPYIDLEKLKREFELVKDTISETEKGIVMVGDNIIKGSDIFRKIANRFPNEKFYIFDRKYKNPEKFGNIIHMPWQKSSVDVYKYAKIIVIPSRCYEAYSRVAKEAIYLGIPVIGSKRGGIPEALNWNKDFLVNNIENIDEWVDKIKVFLK